METSHLPEGYILRGTDHSYRIDGILGQGSFGITYFATTKAYVEGGLGRIETGIKVAVKEFFMQELCSRESDGRVLRQSEGSLVGEYARRFRTEAENLSRLSHPGIVKVLEVFETNGTCYYSMEYFDGGSLEAYVKRVGGLPEGEACGCIRQISQALAYMHSMKMLHLDLKPRNVVCSSDGSRLALIDFGLSKQYKADGLPEASTSIGLGTPGYAPLEQSGADREKDFAPTLDVYALGATYYKLLTGETPPDASSVLNYGLPKDKLIRRGVSESSVTAIERAMAPRKLDRLRNVGEFEDLLPLYKIEKQKVEVFKEEDKRRFREETKFVDSGRINGHEWVDLGLSVKWATCNVGANNPEEYGDYFAWGETGQKRSYEWKNLKYCSKKPGIFSDAKFSKYVAESKHGSVDSKTRLELSDDAARVNWGGSWRMPTKAEQDELRMQCSWQWTTVNGHNGYRVTSKRNGRSIFLPAAGYRYGSSSYGVGSYGNYWSSSLYTTNSFSAYGLGFCSGYVYWSSGLRRDGRSVRAVSE